MRKSTFKVTEIDCPSEEQMIRMKLQSLHNIKKLEFDLQGRVVCVYHEEDVDPITQSLASLQLNSSLLKTEEAPISVVIQNDAAQRKLLKTVFFINFVFFLIEVIAGFIAHSMGLIADSLDMLADAIVYGLSLYAVGRVMAAKKRTAKIGGYFQLALAIFGLLEVIRRFLGFGETPVFETMILISVFALIGNSVSSLLLQRSENKEVHIKASLIFTSNDVLANVGVIFAGILVYFTHSRYPDLIVGLLIFLVVARGAYKIMQLSK